MNNELLARVLLLGVGSVLLLCGLWALHSGKVVSTWARIEYRPSLVYWLTTAALIGAGAMNLVLVLRSLLR